jgi:threonine dehydrogenase-like Zn-dependent dehydrogenase
MPGNQVPDEGDVVVIGAGHNGLVAMAYLGPARRLAAMAETPADRLTFPGPSVGCQITMLSLSVLVLKICTCMVL